MAAQHDVTPPESETAPETPETPAPLNRAERRAAARGGTPTQKIAGPAVGKLPPRPLRARDYAARRSG